MVTATGERAATRPDLVADSDHVQMSRLVIGSAWLVDSGQAETLHELFTDDGELDVGQKYSGSEAIRGWNREIKMPTHCQESGT